MVKPNFIINISVIAINNYQQIDNLIIVIKLY